MNIDIKVDAKLLMPKLEIEENPKFKTPEEREAKRKEILEARELSRRCICE